MASTGSDGTSRRAVLEAMALAPLAALAPPAEAAEYASAREVFDTVDRLEADVASRLEAIARALPAARPFADSVLADHQRHRATRGRLRVRLGLPPAAPAAAAPGSETALEALRAAQEALTFAHAEGLPALGDPQAVDAMARHMVDLSRHLTVVDLWIEAEAQRG